MRLLVLALTLCGCEGGGYFLEGETLKVSPADYTVNLSVRPTKPVPGSRLTEGLDTIHVKCEDHCPFVRVGGCFRFRCHQESEGPCCNILGEVLCPSKSEGVPWQR